jgi:hypothetical protein
MRVKVTSLHARHFDDLAYRFRSLAATGAGPERN